LAQHQITVHGDEKAVNLIPNALPAGEDDWKNEYLSLDIAVKIVNDMDEAIDHIDTYGTKHSEAIITENSEKADMFMKLVDASALYRNASVDFVDIDPDTFNLSIDALSLKLAQAEKEDKLPKILVPVHLCGLSCDMQAIGKLSKKYGFSVIEDASHAIGGKYQDEPVGNCRYSDITVFSFHPVKIITTGEGGSALTNNSDLAERMALLRSHGITRDPTQMTQEPDGPWYYQQIDLGHNYRMTDIQAALGLSQMNRLDDFVKRRHVIAAQYDELLCDLPVLPQRRSVECYSAMHLYLVRITTEKLNKSHGQVFSELRESGIGVNLHYIPVHTQPYYQKLGFNTGDFPQAEKYYTETISLPMFPDLSHDEQGKVVKTLEAKL